MWPLVSGSASSRHILFARPICTAACVVPPSFLGLSDTPGCTQTTCCPSVHPSFHGHLSGFHLLASVGVAAMAGACKYRSPCFQFLWGPRLGVEVLGRVVILFNCWRNSWFSTAAAPSPTPTRGTQAFPFLRIPIRICDLAVLTGVRQCLVLV